MVSVPCFCRESGKGSSGTKNQDPHRRFVARAAACVIYTS